MTQTLIKYIYICIFYINLLEEAIMLKCTSKPKSSPCVATSLEMLSAWRGRLSMAEIESHADAAQGLLNGSSSRTGKVCFHRYSADFYCDVVKSPGRGVHNSATLNVNHRRRVSKYVLLLNPRICSIRKWRILSGNHGVMFSSKTELVSFQCLIAT